MRRSRRWGARQAGRGAQRAIGGVPLATLAVGLIVAMAWSSPSVAKERLDLTYQGIDLPGMPVEVIPVDFDGYGRRDLAMVVAYSEWIQSAFEEHSEMEGIEGLVEILTIVPSLEDRRELWVFLATASGYVASGPPLTLGSEVLAIDAGPGRIPLVALTDAGVVSIVLDESGGLAMHPLVEGRPVLAGSGVYLPDLELTVQLVGDREPDLMLPLAEGLLVLAGTASGFASHGQVVPLPGSKPAGRQLDYPLPEVRDVDGDGFPDLVWPHPVEGWGLTTVSSNRSGVDFAPPRDLEPTWKDGEEVAFFGDLDGDGVAEWVTQEDTEPDEDVGMREEMRLAGAPPNVYRFYRSEPGGLPESKPYHQLDAIGFAFDGGEDIHLPGGFQDLGGDGRQDLITITFDLSIRKALGALATHRLTLPMDFFVHCQAEDGSFHQVQDLDLSGKFKLNLERVEVRGLPMFEGDFDGDGATDFVQFGRGERVTIHRGRAGCAFPSRPDLVLQLKQEAALMELIRVDDLDADGRSDLMVIQPGRRSDGGETPGVRLDLYRSGGGQEP